MGGEELIELKFRLSDGTDIGPNKYHPSTTVGSLKELIISQWPQEADNLSEIAHKPHVEVLHKLPLASFFIGKENGPKAVNDVKLINAGKILENSKTLNESRVSVGEIPGGIITMHVVVQPPLAEKKNEKLLADSPKNRCTCSIL